MIRVRLTSRPDEVVEVYEHQLLDLQRWGLILEYVDEDSILDEIRETPSVIENDSYEGELILSLEELQEYFKASPE